MRVAGVEEENTAIYLIRICEFYLFTIKGPAKIKIKYIKTFLQSGYK